MKYLKKKLLKNGDKIILLGYGGGLNTGSILMEV
jgi:beta-ketoacyl-acyl-carrier-protein synthase III, C-terminal domain protein